MEKSLRLRVNVGISTKGQKTWECTADGVGYTEDEILFHIDSLVKKLEERYSAPSVE